MITCDNLYLRKPTSNDVEELVVLKNNEKAAYLLGGTFHPYSKEDIEKWVAFHNSREDEVLLVIYDNDAQKLIGHVGLYKIDKTARKAEVGILIADDNSRGKGYGTKLINTIIRYGFDTLNLNKVTAEVLSENKASEKMFRKCGFVVDGCLRDDVFKNNRYYDVLSMSVLKRDIL